MTSSGNTYGNSLITGMEEISFPPSLYTYSVEIMSLMLHNQKKKRWLTRFSTLNILSLPKLLKLYSLWP